MDSTLGLVDSTPILVHSTLSLVDSTLGLVDSTESTQGRRGNFSQMIAKVIQSTNSILSWVRTGCVMGAYWVRNGCVMGA